MTSELAGSYSSQSSTLPGATLRAIGPDALPATQESLPAAASLASDIGATTEAVAATLAFAAAPAMFAEATALAAVAGTPNAIVLENKLHRTSTATWQALGMDAWETPRDVWDAAQTNKIEGFTTDISYDLGQTVQFKINVNGTAAATLPYRIEIFRLGYYGGDGATLVTTINNADGTVQPNPVTDASRHLVDAGNWSVTDSWAIPETATSGVYLARLDRLDASGNVIEGASNQIPFIVRNDDSASDIVLQTSDTTWQAYNAWGGNNGLVGSNLYGSAAIPRAYAVSYNRPFVDRLAVGNGAGPQDYLFGADYAALYWLEKNGYEVSYISGVDTDRLGADMLAQHDVYISVGHDEYWSGGQRANVTEARDAGLSLMFLSGNDVYWKTRYEGSIAGTPTAYRTMVTYKETSTNFDPDAPASAYTNLDPSNEWTGTWRDMRFVDAVDANGVHIATGAEPENSLTGQLFAANGEGQYGGSIDVPQAYTGLRQWRGTAVENGSGTYDIAPGIIGYEWDTAPDDASRPAGLVKLSEMTMPWGAVLQDQGNTYAPGTPTHNLTVYRAPSGALVFGTGTVFWSWGLSNEHDQYAPYAATIENPIVKQFMVNMLADMGVQPGSLEAGLAAATASADKTAAVATMNAVTGTIAPGQTVTISGTASDPNAAVDHGEVALVEVSLDGGQTWRPATGTTSWTYSWQAASAGTYQIRARAIDDSLNLPTQLAAQTVTVGGGGAGSPASFFAAGAAPEMVVLEAWDPTDYELGMKFSAAVAGTITDLKYYRGADDANDTDVRTLHLWDTANPTTPLATVSLTSGVGASGWQTAHLSTAVQISANHTYIVSYGTTEDYAKSDAYFTSARTDASGNITVAAGAGVFAVGPGGMPTGTSGNANYWADVIFVAGGTGGGGTPGAPGSFFAAAATPEMVVLEAWDPTDYELGMKFSAQVAGTITDLKYFRGAEDANDTDVRTLHLWDAANPATPLATVSLTSGVGASGWQTAHLSTAVQISANHTYIVSYGTTEDYAKSDAYFTSAQTDASGNLTVVAGAGVFAVGPGGMPTSTSGNANYWADVTFVPGGTGGGGGGTPGTPGSFFGASATPQMVVLEAWDPTDYELGMKFSAKVAGTITDLKYFRGAEDATDSDVRTLHLWDAANPTTPLATVSLTSGVGAAGWQTAHLSSPVHINANTTYIVSYGTTEDYAKSDAYFTGAQTDASGNITVAAGAGVFAVGPGGMPTSTSGNANYWADVTFVPDSAGTSGVAALGASLFARAAATDPATTDASADLVTATAARDVMTGGAGNDTFIFTTAADAGGTTGTDAQRAASRDIVTDFTDGADVIDISQIAHGTTAAWSFDGEVAASGYTGEAGHVHYFIDASGNTIIEGHATSTGGVSFQIQLDGQHALTAQSLHL